MSYKCEILADSLSAQGHRLTTFKVTYPRIIHAELMTHRLFSRNAASSRAIPVRKMIESIRNNMFTHLAIQKAHKGMQGSDYFEGVELEQAKQLWIESAELAIQQAEKMEKFGISKQIVNRVVEPYQYYQVLVTATEWDNFFELRCPKYEIYAGPEDIPEYFCSGRSWKEFMKSNNGLAGDFNTENIVERLQYSKSGAEIHMQALAEAMWDAYNESIPNQLKAGEWHLPFSDKINDGELTQVISPNKALIYSNISLQELRLKVCVSRCARISYQTLGDNPKIDYEADIKLHDRLLESKHASPFEHCARAMSEEEYESFYKGEGANKGHTGIDENKGWCNNYRGFINYRYILENQ